MYVGKRKPNVFTLNGSIWQNEPSVTVWDARALIETQLREVVEHYMDGNDFKQANEWCDIISIAAKQIARLGYSPTKHLRQRLIKRHRGQTRAICARDMPKLPSYKTGDE